MRVQILAIGKVRSGPERQLIDDFNQRSRALAPSLGWSAVEEIELLPKKAGCEHEAALIAEALMPGAIRVILDERGKPEPSSRLAERLKQWRLDAHPAVTFVIGGADGHAPSLRSSAHHLLAFGPQTWPHKLARVMLAEQIYRAATILTGHPYHRA